LEAKTFLQATWADLPQGPINAAILSLQFYCSCLPMSYYIIEYQTILFYRRILVSFSAICFFCFISKKIRMIVAGEM